MFNLAIDRSMPVIASFADPLDVPTAAADAFTIFMDGNSVARRTDVTIMVGSAVGDPVIRPRRPRSHLGGICRIRLAWHDSEWFCPLGRGGEKE